MLKVFDNFIMRIMFAGGHKCERNQFNLSKCKTKLKLLLLQNNDIQYFYGMVDTKLLRPRI